jgi:hypothetical protein
MSDNYRSLGVADPRYETPKGFKGELYPPQKTVLYQMIKFEQTKRFYYSDKNDKTYIKINRALLNENISFGKTLVALALIIAAKNEEKNGTNTPKIENIPLTSLMSTALMSTIRSRYNGASDRDNLMSIELKVKNLINATFVIVQTSIISEWEQNIKTFSSLKYFTIHDCKTLLKFQQLFYEKKINEFDIILAKAGKVTNKYAVPGEDAKTVPAQRTISNIVSLITEGSVWKRVIIDDFDSIKLTSGDKTMTTLFTWFISSTRRRSKAQSNFIESGDIDEPNNFISKNINVNSFAEAVNNDSLFELLSVKCLQSYLNEYLNSTKINCVRYVVKGGNAAKLLNNLGISKDAIEALNAGALKTVAERYNIVARDEGDIVRHVLNTCLDKYKEFIDVEIKLKKILTNYPIIFHDIDYNKIKYEKKEDVTKNEVEIFVDILKTKTMEDINYVLDKAASFEIIREGMNEVIVRNKMNKEKYGNRLDRLKSNVKEGYCQCCSCPFDDSPVYILNGCCQLLICSDCIVEGAESNKKYISRCPNCMEKVDLKKIIYIDQNINLERIFDDSVVFEKDQEKTEKTNVIYNAKIDVLVKLMNEEVPNTIDYVQINTMSEANLLWGNMDIPYAGGDKKWLIVGVYPESSAEISQVFTKLGINHVLLSGDKNKIERLKKIYKEDDACRAMIVTASKDYSGMNLQFTTHLALFHNIINNDVRTQAIGRAQRLGRKCNLTVIEIFYESEI